MSQVIDEDDTYEEQKLRNIVKLFGVSTRLEMTRHLKLFVYKGAWIVGLAYTKLDQHYSKAFSNQRFIHQSRVIKSFTS